MEKSAILSMCPICSLELLLDLKSGSLVGSLVVTWVENARAPRAHWIFIGKEVNANHTSLGYVRFALKWMIWNFFFIKIITYIDYINKWMKSIIIVRENIET